jgi:hypothetical protein
MMLTWQPSEILNAKDILVRSTGKVPS